MHKKKKRIQLKIKTIVIVLTFERNKLSEDFRLEDVTLTIFN